LEDISFERITELYKAGDPAVEAVVRKAADAIGTAAGNIFTTLPAAGIILTGHLMSLGGKYFSAVEESIRKTAFPLFMEKTVVSESKHSGDNAAFGACSVILRSFFEGRAPVSEPLHP
jgi:predicted NBD/HSP70 family sugar kinase